VAEVVQGFRRYLMDDFLSREINSNIPNFKTKREKTIIKKTR
jgi:hypothetical protein